MNQQLPEPLAYTKNDLEAEAASEQYPDEAWKAYYQHGNPERKLFEERMTRNDWKAIRVLLEEATIQPPRY